jgi:hypothetical protein
VLSIGSRKAQQVDVIGARDPGPRLRLHPLGRVWLREDDANTVTALVLDGSDVADPPATGR